MKLKFISGLVQIGSLRFVKALGGIEGYSWKFFTLCGYKASKDRPNKFRRCGSKEPIRHHY